MSKQRILAVLLLVVSVVLIAVSLRGLALYDENVALKMRLANETKLRESTFASWEICSKELFRYQTAALKMSAERGR